MNFRSKKWTVALLVFLIILAIGIFIQFSVGTGVLRDNLKSVFLNSYYQNPFHKQSEVSASLTDTHLNLDFEILDDDKLTFQNFVNNWFGTSEDIKSIKIGIDENMVKMLSPILPAKLNLKVTDKSLELKSQSTPVLKTAITGTEINFATESGKFKLKYASPTQYNLELENPSDLALYATESGVLTASTKIDGLFKSLPQVATIELSVSGKNITGRVVLK